MELSDLAVFRAVVRAGGVSRAAALLHRVQSNVTTRVRNLEEDLGVALFVREHRRMQLTAAGRVLVEYADRLITLADEARAAVADSRPRGTLRVGAMESTAAVRLPQPLSRLHRKHADLSVELRTGNPRALVELVLSGALDAALVAEPVADPRLETRAVFDEALVLVSPAGHAPIASARDVTTPTLLAFEPGCPHRQRAEAWFARAQVAPDRIVEMGSYHAILGCAVAGMGVAVMPKSVVDAYAERALLGVHALTGPFRSVRTLLVWRRDAPHAKIAALADALRDAPAPPPRRGAAETATAKRPAKGRARRTAAARQS